MKGHRKCLHFLRKYSNIIWRCEKRAVYMQRCLSGLRSTIGNRVMRERIRRFESSSLRQGKTRLLGRVFSWRGYEFEGTPNSRRFARGVRNGDVRKKRKAGERRSFVALQQFSLLCAKKKRTVLSSPYKGFDN